VSVAAREGSNRGVLLNCIPPNQCVTRCLEGSQRTAVRDVDSPAVVSAYCYTSHGKFPGRARLGRSQKDGLPTVGWFSIWQFRAIDARILKSGIGDRSDLCAIHMNRLDQAVTGLDWLAVTPLCFELTKLVDQPAIRAFVH
jgi:hypothetical protein